MLDRTNIHNSAILKPQFYKSGKRKFCKYYFQTKRHAFTDNNEGYEQCIECGRIKSKGNNYGLHKQHFSR